MGASVQHQAGPAAAGAAARARHTPMHEINVTPFVDVMLVLLIIFMVTAPLLTVGVPIELPEAKGQQLQIQQGAADHQRRQRDGKVFIQETEIKLDEIAPKLKAIAKNGYDEQIFVRGDKGIDYGTVMRVMGADQGGRLHKVSLVTEIGRLLSPRERGQRARRTGHLRHAARGDPGMGALHHPVAARSCAWPSPSRSPSTW